MDQFFYEIIIESDNKYTGNHPRKRSRDPCVQTNGR